MIPSSPRIQGQHAINVLRVASDGKGGQTVTIGTEIFELTTKDDLSVTAGRIPVDLHAGSTVKAQGKLTFGGLPQDTGTVTIGGKAYTFQTVLTNVDGHVLIGADAEETIDNLVAAILRTPSLAGTAYAVATSKHTTVTAAKSGTDKCIITAIEGGTSGNSITLAEAADNVTKDAATLGTETLGVDPPQDEVLAALESTINDENEQRLIATNVDDTYLLIQSEEIDEVALACSETLTGSNNAWAANAMYGGARTKTRKMAVAQRVPKQVEVDVDEMRFELTFEPSVVIPWIYPTATPGAHKHWNGGITIDGKHVTLDNGSSVDWATTDTVEVIFIE